MAFTQSVWSITCKNQAKNKTNKNKIRRKKQQQKNTFKMINLKTSDLFLFLPIFWNHNWSDSASDDNLFVLHGRIYISPATTFVGVLLRGSARLGVRASMGLKLLQKLKQKTELVSHHHCKIVIQHLLHYQHVREVWTVKRRQLLLQ